MLRVGFDGNLFELEVDLRRLDEQATIKAVSALESQNL